MEIYYHYISIYFVISVFIYLCREKTNDDGYRLQVQYGWLDLDDAENNFVLFRYRRPCIRLIYVRSKWKVIAEEEDNVRILYLFDGLY